MQSVIYMYMLAKSYYLKDNSYYFKKKILAQPTWYLNSLFYQFWVSFLGVLLLIYALVIFFKNIYFIDWLNTEIFLYFYLIINFYIKNFEIIIVLFPLVLGLLLKLGLLPFFFWKPEIYKNLNLNILFLYMTSYLFSIIYLLIFIITNYFFLINNLLYYYFYLIIVLSLIILPIILYSIVEIRIFLAYTSIFHVVIIIISLFYNNIFFNITFIYLLTYMFYSTLFITLLYCVSSFNVWYLTDFQFFLKYNIINTTIFNIFIGMSGIPPFLGFFSKLLIISSILFYENYFLFILFLISSLIISFYYIQNYRFFGYSLKSINYCKNKIFLLLNYNYLNFLIIFIFFNIFSFFFINEYFIISYLFKIN